MIFGGRKDALLMAIQEVVKNKKYRIFVSLANGKRKSEIFYGKKSEAERFENELKTKYKTNTLSLKDGMKLTELIAEWIDYKRDKVALKTYKAYELYSKNIENGIGHIKLKNINAKILEDFYRDLKENTTLAEKTIKEHYNIISNIFNLAIKWGYIAYNPNNQVERIKVHKKEIEFYTPSEVQQLISALDNEKYLEDLYIHARNKALILLAIDSGCRRGEITRPYME